MTMRISRALALKKNKKYFFTGIACKNGHISLRVVRTYKCLTCKREWEQEWRRKNPDKDKIIRAKEVRKNALGYKKRFEAYATRKGKKYLHLLRKRYKQTNTAAVNENISKRRAHLIKAIPKWYEKERCQEVYKMANILTKTTGVKYEVDHIIPLISNMVCGLHCFDNLQILTATENRNKSNIHT